MIWRNGSDRYGLVSIALHWSMAVLILFLYALGQYMVGLDYTHPWYHQAPDLHRGLGVVAALLWLLRLAWRLADPPPAPLGRPWERRLARAVHGAFYVLIPLLALSGYLVTTADGHPLRVFGLLQIPALTAGGEAQEEGAGALHEALANLLIALAALHALAALKHHFLDRDPTLLRMLRPGVDPARFSPSHEKE